MGFLGGFYGISMGFLSVSYAISMLFPLYFYGISIESKLKAIENQLKVN
jgi:hypothetical protein